MDPLVPQPEDELLPAPGPLPPPPAIPDDSGLSLPSLGDLQQGLSQGVDPRGFKVIDTTGNVVFVPHEMAPNAIVTPPPTMASPVAPAASVTPISTNQVEPTDTNVDRRFTPPPPPLEGTPVASVGQPRYGTTTTTDTTVRGMNPGAEKALKDSAAKQQEAILKTEAAEQRVNDAAIAHKTAVSNELMIDANKREAANKQYFDDVANRRTQIEQTVQELANTKIDASNFWADKSTGDRMAVGIALMLGSFGQQRAAQVNPNDPQAMARNPVMDNMAKMIEADLEKQKFNYENKKNTLQNQRGLLADYMGQYKDMNMAKDAARATYYQALENQFSAIAQTSKSPLIAAQAAERAADAGLKVQEGISKLSTYESNTKTVEAPLKGTEFATKEAPESALGLIKNSQSALQGAERQRKFIEGMNPDSFGRVAQAIRYAKKIFSSSTDPKELKLAYDALPQEMRGYKQFNPGSMSESDKEDVKQRIVSLDEGYGTALSKAKISEDAARNAYAQERNQFLSLYGDYAGGRYPSIFTPAKTSVGAAKNKAK